MIKQDFMDFRQKFLDATIIIFSTSILLSNLVASAIASHFVPTIHYFTVLGLAILLAFRQKLAIEAKIYAVCVFIGIYVSTNIYYDGISVGNICFILFIPLLAFTFLPFPKSLLITLTGAAAYVASMLSLGNVDLLTETLPILFIYTILTTLGLFAAKYHINNLDDEKFVRLNAIFENSRDAICISKNGICLQANAIFQSLFEYSEEELTGKNLTELISDKEKNRIQEYVKNRPEQKDLPFVYETIGLTKNGAQFPFETKISTFEYKNEVYTISIVQDITERRLAEKTLKESEERFRLLAENSTDMISRHTPEGVYLYSSPACERLYGYKPDELVGRSAFEFLHPEDLDAVEQSRSTIIDQHTAYTVAYRANRKDGKLIWLETISNVIQDPASGKTIEIHCATRDITERKLAEEALKKSEEKFMKIFDRAPVLISMTDFETGVYVDVNYFSLTFSGYTKEEVIGKRSVDVGWITPQNRQILVDTIVNYGKLEGLEMPFTTKSGDIVYAIINGEKVNLNGKDYLLSIATDITERKKTEQALMESETLYANLFEYSPIGLQFYGPDGLLLKLNNACLEIFGVVDTDDIKNWNLFNDPNVTEEKKEALLRGETTRYIMDFDFDLVKSLNLYRTTRSGVRIFDVSLSSLGFGYFAQIIDITEQHIAEQELIKAKNKAEESYTRFLNAISATSDAVWEINYQTNEGFFSQRWFEMLGYEQNELEINPGYFEKLCHPDDYQRIMDTIVTSIQNSVSYAAEFRMKTKNGEWKWILGRGSVALRDKNGQPLILSGTNTDITERKIIEEELSKHRNHLEGLVKEKTEELEATNEEIRATNEVLYKKNEIIEQQNIDLNHAIEHLKDTQAQLFQTEKMASLGILTAGVAHEINNPLNYIMGAYEGLNVVLANTEAMEDENVPILLSSLKTGVDRVAKIVKGLNQFSRSTDIINEKCDIHNIVDNCLVILNKQYKDRIEIIKQYPSETTFAIGNAGKLHQVFTNVIGNAIQSIEKTGAISIEVKADQDHVMIEITDNGSGISKENISKLTEPFFTTKDPGKGTGLGLAITYSILNELKGTLEFQSELNKGTKVIIILPAF